MTMQTLTLRVPEPLYGRLQRRAQNAQRPIEEELLDVLETAVRAEDDLSPELANALRSLDSLDDADLQRAARSRLAVEASEGVAELHSKRQREGLTPHETQTLDDLVRQYERAMLIRARAAELLKKRGHNVDSLLACP